MLDGPTIFKSEDLEADLATRKIILGVPEDELTILERPQDVDPRRGQGQPFEERG